MSDAALEAKIETHTLTLEAIDNVIDAIKQVGATDEGLNQLKQTWPQYRFFLCSDDDMGAKEPYWSCAEFSIFLIAASLGCASLTNDPASSAGVIIATIEADEE